MTATTRDRRFLGRRKSAEVGAFDRHVRRAISEWTELKIKTALGMEFRQTGRVVVVRPWWMPDALFRRLLRSIVIETKDVGVR